MPVTLSIGKVHRTRFPLHLKEIQGTPVIGAQFLTDYKVTIDKANEKIHLVWKPEKPAEEKQRLAQEYHDDYFDVPFRRVYGPNDQPVSTQSIQAGQAVQSGAMIVNVEVDNANVPMEFHAGGSMQMSTEQLRAIDTSYFDTGDTTTSLNGTLMTTDKTVMLKRVRLGKIQAYKVLCNVIDYNSARYQAYKYQYSEYPKLGSELCAGWDFKVDDKMNVIHFMKHSGAGTNVDGRDQDNH